jgi:tRNA G46 methylase TrmB
MSGSGKCDDYDDNDVDRNNFLVVDNENAELFSTSASSSTLACEATPENKTSLVSTRSQNSHQKYNARKPKWWKNLGGKLSKAQKRAMTEVLQKHRLPRIPYGSFLEWNEVFPVAAGDVSREIWLEIGFGRGENLLALAHRKRASPGTCFVGAEVHPPGTGTLCARVLQGMQSHQYWTDYTIYTSVCDPWANVVDSSNPTSVASGTQSSSLASVPEEQDNEPSSVLDETSSTADPYSNLRIFPGDGVKLLPYIPSFSLSVVLVTFPDPFPKEDQAQWRVMQRHTLLEIHRVLKSGAGRLFLATDHEGYYQWTHHLVEQCNTDSAFGALDNTTTDERHSPTRIGFRLVEPCPDRMDWLPVVSRYEQKGWDEGRSTKLSCWSTFPEA